MSNPIYFTSDRIRAERYYPSGASNSTFNSIIVNPPKVTVDYSKLGSMESKTLTPAQNYVNVTKLSTLNMGVEHVSPGTLDTSKATKLDAGKANWSLMPFEALEEVVKVLEFGAVKYKGWNFAEGEGLTWTRVTNSLLRHTFAWMRGEDKDPESNLSHIAHVGCNVVFLLYYIAHGNHYEVSDDRFKR